MAIKYYQETFGDTFLVLRGVERTVSKCIYVGGLLSEAQQWLYHVLLQ
jgi:hypothetical protein